MVGLPPSNERLDKVVVLGDGDIPRLQGQLDGWRIVLGQLDLLGGLQRGGNHGEFGDLRQAIPMDPLAKQRQIKVELPKQPSQTQRFG